MSYSNLHSRGRGHLQFASSSISERQLNFTIQSESHGDIELPRVPVWGNLSGTLLFHLPIPFQIAFTLALISSLQMLKSLNSALLPSKELTPHDS